MVRQQKNNINVVLSEKGGSCGNKMYSMQKHIYS